MSLEKQKQFHKELKALLKKFNAELEIEDFGTGWGSDNKMVVDFRWDVKTEDEATPQLILGTFEDGN